MLGGWNLDPGPTVAIVSQRLVTGTLPAAQEPVVALVPTMAIFYSAMKVDMVATQVSELHRITIDPDVCGGRPSVRGLRIRVKDVLDLLAAGASHEEVLQDYPYLEPEDIVAVLEYAARQSDHPVLSVA